MMSLQTTCWCKLPSLPFRSNISTTTKEGRWVSANLKVGTNVRAGMLQDVANTTIPTSSGSSILAFMACPNSTRNKVPLLILIHEFWGLAPEICRKAEALADELGCIVIAPDTFRGESTRFIPKAIFLALSTLQDRVNTDLDEVLSWASSLPEADVQNVGIVGFCYGGGKAIRYAAHYKRAKAVAIVYGKPLLDVEALKNIQGSVIGIFGDKDTQFSLKEIKGFEEALGKAGVKGKISLYEGQGHAFWRDMDQVRKGDGPQRQVWIELTSFFRNAFYGQQDVSMLPM